LTEKTCPDCAEKVKAEARVCRFCGYSFDLAEEQQRRAEEEASLTGWQRFVRSIEEREPTPRVRTKTPASCCGCSCGSSGVIFVALVAATLTWGGLGVAGSVIIGIAAAVLATRLLNAAVQRPLVARVLRLPSPTVEERLAG
jgi:Uncharacterised protein family UPF0547